MKRARAVLIGCFLLVGFASVATAQPYGADHSVLKRFQLFGQYTRQFDSFDETSNLQHIQEGLNGRATGGLMRLWHGLAAKGEISGTSGNYNPLSLFSDPQSSLLVIGGLGYMLAFRRATVFGEVLGR